MKRPPFLLFGIPIENVTLDETIELIGRFVSRGREHGLTHQVATVNIDFLANAVDDASIAHILRTADLCLADGMPLVWAGSRLDMPLVERVAGADLVPRLFDASQTTGWHVHVFGSSPDVSDRARRLVAERFPHGSVTFDSGPRVGADGSIDDEALNRLAAVDADIVCVALGNPKQERFIERHRARIGAPVLIGVGGSLDMMVGERKRAPQWVQRIGLEWVARAAQEPKRLGVRYARDITQMGPWLLGQWRTHRRRRALPGIAIDRAIDHVVARLGGTPGASDEDWTAAAESLTGGATLRIDPTGTEQLNDRAAALLVGLVHEARRAGAPVVWEQDPGVLASAFVELGIVPPAVACDDAWHAERTG